MSGDPREVDAEVLAEASDPAFDRVASNHAYSPLVARTRTVHRPVGPVAYDCVKFIIVRHGSAFLFSEFGQQPVKPGDVVMLGANVLCGSEPEGHITVTTIYADTDFMLD